MSAPFDTNAPFSVAFDLRRLLRVRKTNNAFIRRLLRVRKTNNPFIPSRPARAVSRDAGKRPSHLFLLRTPQPPLSGGLFLCSLPCRPLPGGFRAGWDCGFVGTGLRACPQEGQPRGAGQPRGGVVPAAKASSGRGRVRISPHLPLSGFRRNERESRAGKKAFPATLGGKKMEREIRQPSGLFFSPVGIEPAAPRNRWVRNNRKKAETIR